MFLNSAATDGYDDVVWQCSQQCSYVSCSFSFPLCTGRGNSVAPETGLVFWRYQRRPSPPMPQAVKPIQEDDKWLKVSRRLGPPSALTLSWPQEREPSLGRPGYKYSHSSPGKESCCAFTGESRVDEEEGKASQILRGLALQAAKMDISHRSMGPGKNVPDPGPSSSFSSEAEGPHPSPESSKREKGKGSHWASSAVSKDFWIIWPSFNSQLWEKPWTHYLTNLLIYKTQMILSVPQVAVKMKISQSPHKSVAQSLI